MADNLSIHRRIDAAVRANDGRITFGELVLALGGNPDNKEIVATLDQLLRALAARGIIEFNNSSLQDPMQATIISAKRLSVPAYSVMTAAGLLREIATASGNLNTSDAYQKAADMLTEFAIDIPTEEPEPAPPPPSLPKPVTSDRGSDIRDRLGYNAVDTGYDPYKRR